MGIMRIYTAITGHIKGLLGISGYAMVLLVMVLICCIHG